MNGTTVSNRRCAVDKGFCYRGWLFNRAVAENREADRTGALAAVGTDVGPFRPFPLVWGR
jgi:hypothetical protein